MIARGPVHRLAHADCRAPAAPSVSGSVPAPLHRRLELHVEQRRMAVMALASCAWLLGAALIGTPEALAYLAPPLTILALLAFGRYPGAVAFERRLRARRAASPRPRSRSAQPRVVPALPLPRGGALLAAGLAGRAPPLTVA